MSEFFGNACKGVRKGKEGFLFVPRDGEGSPMFYEQTYLLAVCISYLAKNREVKMLYTLPASPVFVDGYEVGGLTPLPEEKKEELEKKIQLAKVYHTRGDISRYFRQVAA